MKKAATFYIIFCTVVLIFTSILPTVRASINDHNWIGTTLRNDYDPFYGTSVTAYEEGKMAGLAINVYNDYSAANQVNVSAVIVGFDWGTNYTSDECNIDNPWAIRRYESKVFTMTFTVPSSSVASNLVTHSYIIYVEHVNSTTGNKEIVDTWTQSGHGFAVFSSDQATIHRLEREINAYAYYQYVPVVMVNSRELLTMSRVAKSMGEHEYNVGNFNGAITHYQNALEFVQQAWSNETEKWSTFEDTFVSILRGSENLLLMYGYAWLIFGIGFLLISIGALVYLVMRARNSKN
ncbi:MAG: hypothetical protein JSV05_07035 [Candidatus Bathyarchaeota archaeon]|nr:MAG: hypothetical protein JSV05_07035 [Candidatus Bathyarchaeota archaeon]